MVVLLLPSYFMFIAYCKTIVSCISLYFCMIWSGFYSLHVFSHIFGYCDYNFHCIITLDLAFIVRYIFLHCCLKRKYFPTTNTDSPPGRSLSPIPQRCGTKKHFYLSYLPHSLPWFWNLSVQFSSVAQSCLTLCDPIDCHAPLSMGFSRQEYCSGLPCPPPGDLPNPEIKPEPHVSCIGRSVLYLWHHLGSPKFVLLLLLSRFSRVRLCVTP